MLPSVILMSNPDLRSVVVRLANHVRARAGFGAITTAGFIISLIWRQSRVALAIGIFSASISAIMTYGSFADSILFHEDAVRAQASLAASR